MTDPESEEPQETAREAPEAEAPAVEEMHAGEENTLEPGAYIDHDTGRLIRVSVEMARSAAVRELIGHADRPVVLTRISEQPYISRVKARLLACNRNLPVRF